MGFSCDIKVKRELIIIWIDSNIENEENSNYVSKLLKMKLSKFKQFTNVDTAINYMKTIKFKETKIIVSGKLYTELIEKFKKNVVNMYVAPKILVFTFNIDEFFLNNKEYHYIKNKFYSAGGVALTFRKVEEFLKSDYNNICEDKIESEKSKNPDEVQLTFDYIDRKEKLLLPMFFKVLIDDTPSNDMQRYTNILYNTFSGSNDKLKILLGSIKSIPNIPLEILSKYYVRLYTLQSDFHDDLNKKLGLNKGGKYISFIKILYEGVKFKSLPLSNDKILYRGSKISNEEINIIKKYMKIKIGSLSIPIVFCRAFLSFSKDKSVAESFLKEINDKNFSNVLFILEKNDKIGYNLSTHGDIEKISAFTYEQEVLFFPFSSFEVKDIKEKYINKEKIYEINLLYLGQYLKDIEKDKKLVRKENILPDSEFKKHLIEFGLIKKEKMDNMNTKLLYEEYIKYKKAVGEYQLEENIIRGEINIGLVDVNKDIQIINSFENVKRIHKLKIEKSDYIYKNEKEIKDSIVIKINDNEIKFSYSYKFKNIGKFKIDYIFQNDITNLNYLFYECKNITNLDFSDYYSSKINNMENMFFNCKSLISLDLTNFETESVVSMRKMFSDCISLKNLNLTSINTESVKDMSQMFSGCISLTNLNMSNFNTEAVKNMSQMFSGCKALTNIDLSNFNTESVKDMSQMFFGCKALTQINLTNFNTKNVLTFSSMFRNCNSLKTLDVSNFNSEKATDMSNMFSDCYSLEKINFTNFHTNNVINMESLFYNCNSLKDLNLSSFDTKNVTNMCKMFSGCTSLTNIDLSKFNTEKVSNMSEMFSDCKSLTNLNLSNFLSQNLNNMSKMFYFCESLLSLDLSTFNTEKVTDMSLLFSGCKSLSNLDISNFKSVNVTNMSSMFSGCDSLKNLKLSDSNPHNVMLNTFSFCENLNDNNIKITDSFT